MDFLINIAEHFTGLFQAGADQFTSFVGGMIPLIACLILFVNALIQFIGEDDSFHTFEIHRYSFLGLFLSNEPNVLYLWNLFRRRIQGRVL
jgi:sorbitol-specific phosphotransferase system component IIC